MSFAIKRALRKACSDIPRFLESPCVNIGDQCCSSEFYGSSSTTTKKTCNNKLSLIPEKN